jgi:transcriptional regulator
MTDDAAGSVHSRKKGAAELLVLAQLEVRPCHGYEIARRIGERSGGVVSFKVTSLYPILHKLEERGMIAGRWIEKGGRRRRHYRLTEKGRKTLANERRDWNDFMAAVETASGPEYA